jgi:thiamine pyrophosphate-dependent acetolactate synthase large subunit-like protein
VSRTVATVVAEYLSEAGVSHVFTYPGDPTVEFLEALRRQGTTCTATRIEATDLVKLAESMHCDGVRVTSVAELERATEGINDLARPLLVEAIIDPAQYEAQF